MMTNQGAGAGAGPQFVAKGAVLLGFIVALEIVIMISPFAMFFYAVFNPFLLALASLRPTRWLTAFFLPHMIVPPTPCSRGSGLWARSPSSSGCSCSWRARSSLNPRCSR